MTRSDNETTCSATVSHKEDEKILTRNSFFFHAEPVCCVYRLRRLK